MLTNVTIDLVRTLGQSETCPQAILKVRPPNSLDYRARYDTPAVIFLLND